MLLSMFKGFKTVVKDGSLISFKLQKYIFEVIFIVLVWFQKDARIFSGEKSAY